MSDTSSASPITPVAPAPSKAKRASKAPAPIKPSRASSDKMRLLAIHEELVELMAKRPRFDATTPTGRAALRTGNGVLGKAISTYTAALNDWALNINSLLVEAQSLSPDANIRLTFADGRTADVNGRAYVAAFTRDDVTSRKTTGNV